MIITFLRGVKVIGREGNLNTGWIKESLEMRCRDRAMNRNEGGYWKTGSHVGQCTKKREDQTTTTETAGGGGTNISDYQSFSRPY